LLDAVKKITETTQPVSTFTEAERIRGKDEYRSTSVFLSTNQVPEGWCQINRVIHVERYFESKNNIHHTNSFYISSVNSNDAKLFAKGVRGHWLIENRLHYVKDAIMREDFINNNSKHAPENMSIIRNIAINIFNTKGYKSTKYTSLFFASNVNKLLKVLICRT
jgi:predicted transposase YbfD/YdcC